MLEKIKPLLNLNDEFYSDDELKKLDLKRTTPPPPSTSNKRKDDAYVAGSKQLLGDYEVYYD